MWMPSLDLATGLWARMRRTLYTLFSRLSRAAQRFWMSRAYFPVLLTVSAAFMAAGEPVYGVAALGCIVIWLLAACPDLLAPVCPFFMAFLMSSQCYGQLTDFLPCAALVPPLLVALLWHFAVWPVTLRIGRSGLGLALVSIATLLGGCDVISRKQAMEPLSLYYTLGLGVGMLVLYVLFRSHLTEKRSYDLHRRFAEIFCALGLCMALAVLLAYGKAWLAEGHIGGVLYLSYRNFATSVLLTALPMPFYLSLRHRGHLATAAVLALGTCAAYGGIPAAKGSVTEAMGTGAMLKQAGIKTPVVNIPGCPPQPDWIVGTIALALQKIKEKGLEAGLAEVVSLLDSEGRPLPFYGRNVHENCPYLGKYDEGKFSATFTEKDGCRYDLGCKGPGAYCDSFERKWNGVNWCVANAICIGCTEPSFPDGQSPFYSN